MNESNVLPNWDNKSFKYGLEKHNWPVYWLNVAKEKFPQITSLETVHTVLTPTELKELGEYCQSKFNTDELKRKIDLFYKDIVPANLEQEEWLIQRYFTIRIVIPNQQSVGRLLAFHKDEWTGNGLGILTVWTPITRCYSTNSMQVVNTEESTRISNTVLEQRWSTDKLQEECLRYAEPVSLNPGEVHLFQQHHFHGNVNNETDITRWSMDGRILPKGGEYNRKYPGGYFRFLDEQDDNRPVDNNMKWLSYVGWNSKFSDAVPLHWQRNVIKDYCNKNNISLNDYQFEMEHLDWMPNLEKYITGYNIDGIVMCSIYCLPDDPFNRFRLLKLAIDNNVQIHFANELCSVRDEDDIKYIQKIFEYVI